MKRVCVGLLLAWVCLASGGANNALSATADWAEEMTALPGPNWGAWDDFDGRMKNDITLIDLNGNPGTGAWKRPQGSESTGAASYGMAWIDPASGNPKDALPSMSGDLGPAQYTAEIRFRIVGPTSTEPEDEFDMMWFNVGGGHLKGNSGPDIRMAEGNYANAGHGDPGHFHSWSGEGLSNTIPSLYWPPASVFGGTSRDEWHTLRLIQDEVGGTQKVYFDNTLIPYVVGGEPQDFTYDISDYPNGRLDIRRFTRGLSFGAYGLPSDFSLLPEVWYDYIRLANGIVPIGEPINAPGGVTFDAADFDQDRDVDAADYSAWAANFGLASGATKAQGDSSADGDVDGADFLKWQEQYGRRGGGFAAVPEPATTLAATLMAGALLARRRRA